MFGFLKPKSKIKITEVTQTNFIDFWRQLFFPQIEDPNVAYEKVTQFIAEQTSGKAPIARSKDIGIRLYHKSNFCFSAYLKQKVGYTVAFPIIANANSLHFAPQSLSVDKVTNDATLEGRCNELATLSVHLVDFPLSQKNIQSGKLNELYLYGIGGALEKFDPEEFNKKLSKHGGEEKGIKFNQDSTVLLPIDGKFPELHYMICELIDREKFLVSETQLEIVNVRFKPQLPEEREIVIPILLNSSAVGSVKEGDKVSISVCLFGYTKPGANLINAFRDKI